MKKIFSSLLLLTCTASIYSQSLNCPAFCILTVNGLDTVGNTINVTIANQDTVSLNYPVVVLVNTLGDTVANINAQPYYFAQPAHDTLVHTIPCTLDSIPGGFTGTVYLSDGLTDSTCSYSFPMTCTVGIAELALNHKVNIYPNPADDHVTVSSDASLSEETIIRLYDITGRQLRTYNTNENVFVIPRGELPQGIYFAAISFDGKIFTKRIIFR